MRGMVQQGCCIGQVFQCEPWEGSGDLGFRRHRLSMDSVLLFWYHVCRRHECLHDAKPCLRLAMPLCFR
jgi:hypothetical protein